MNASSNRANGDRYQRNPRFVNWADRPSNSPAARFAGEQVPRQLKEMNDFLDADQAQGVVSGAEALLAAEERRRAAKAAAVVEGWKRGDPGE